MLSSMKELIDRAASRPATLAVASAADGEVLQAALEAKRLGVAEAILTGGPESIGEILRGLGASAEAFQVIPCQSPAECAGKAVQLVREGRASCLMKGSLTTADIMRAAIDKDTGIRGNRLMSHIMLYQMPGYPKALAVTDGGMNTFPALEQKADILENAAIALKKLGYERIYAACVCGAEAVNPKIQSTLDAAALANMAGRWAPYNMSVYGPVGLDLAISPAACAHKGYSAPGAGEADILLVPTYEVGNGIGKALTYFANAKPAGIVVGAKAPIVLTSRADTAETKLYSIALGCLAG